MITQFEVWQSFYLIFLRMLYSEIRNCVRISTLCGPDHAALVHTLYDHVWNQRLVSTIRWAVLPGVVPGSCSHVHLSMFIRVTWLL